MYKDREQVERKVTANREWRARNRAKHTETQYTWQANNPLSHLLNVARARAKQAGLEFTLTASDFSELPTHCPVFGFELKYGGRGPRAYNSASLDRIDSERGYIPGNVQIISWRANDLKRDATVDELETLLTFLRSSTDGHR